MYKTPNKGTKKKNNFLHEVTRNWIMKWGDMADSSSNEDNAVPLEKKPATRGPSEDPPRILGKF
jgi:hypothetical protein